MNNDKRLGIMVLLSLMFALINPSVQAHEPRDGVANGAYNISVGHRVEPGFAGEPNAFDFIIRNADDTPADVEQIKLEVMILFLKEDATDAKVKRKEKLTGELRRDFSQPNRFNIWYLPARAGAYGFHIKGMVDGNMIDEMFVCGGGSLNPSGRSFGCISNIQAFPGGKNRESEDDD